MTLTWEQKLQALQALGNTSLRMRKPGDWYVSQNGVSIREGSILKGSYGNGKTPEEAVTNHWLLYSAPTNNQTVVIDDGRRGVCWNGFMWQSVE